MRVRGVLFIIAVTVSLLLTFMPASNPQPVVTAAADCTKVGTNDRNVLAGTADRDVICALGGNDYAHGRADNDVLRGSGGRDTLIGGEGADRLKGGSAGDRLFSVDERGGDRLDGGPGKDRCFMDTGDHAVGCEERFIGVTVQAINGLSNSFGGALTLAERLIGSPTVPPAPVPGEAVPATTVTTTVTVPFPPCTPPPDTLPNPCD